MDELLPEVDQRFCVRHLYNNFRKKYPDKKLKELMWKAAKTTYDNAFNDVMNEIKAISEGAYEYLKKIPARHWSKSRFTSGPLCDTLVNNMSEAFNSTIIIARGKPVVTMFEEIRVYLMERWEANRQKIARYEDEVLPNIKKRIAREYAYTNNWLVRYVFSYNYCQFDHYVSANYDYWLVNLYTEISYHYVSSIMITGWLLCIMKFLANLLTCLGVEVNMIMKSDAFLH